MKERILQLLDLEKISPSKFADLIGVQRSSVSHVISGRNKPSFDFLQKTLKAFPGLKADWLMLGDGPMYGHMVRNSDLFDVSSTGEELKEDDISAPIETQSIPDETFIAHNEQDTIETNEDDSVLNNSPKVLQVMIFYDDDTFTSFKPTQ
jgi:transcriptional regulator with XRE-family HTH domain